MKVSSCAKCVNTEVNNMEIEKKKGKGQQLRLRPESEIRTAGGLKCQLSPDTYTPQRRTALRLAGI